MNKTPIRKRVFFNGPAGVQWVSNHDPDIEYFWCKIGGDLYYRRVGSEYTLVVPHNQILRYETTASFDYDDNQRITDDH